MLDIKIVERKGQNLIDTRLLHKSLEVKSQHADWIRRRIDNYGFEEGKDYFFLPLKNEKQKRGRGGHNLKTYLVTLDMAKELCMLENSEVGKKTRRYFIKCEKEFRKSLISIEALRQTRKTLTDAIKESDENERMHGHAYSSYTRMAYKLAGLTARKKEWGKAPGFRESLSPDELKRVEAIESMSKTMVEIGKQYDEIKEALQPLFISVTPDKIDK